MNHLLCRNCGHDRRAHEIGLCDERAIRIILPGYKESLRECLLVDGYNPDPNEVKKIEVRKMKHLGKNTTK
jgi:hypothetical protein